MLSRKQHRMNIEILMSTVNRKTPDWMNPAEKNITTDVLIINQIENVKVHENTFNGIRMYDFNETGTSVSKNRALEYADGDICILSDDDTVYVPGYAEVIKESFFEYPDADILIFQIITPDGKLYKKYSGKPRILSVKDASRISMLEIVFKREQVIRKGVWFDRDFGINCRYRNGEENIFFRDCVAAGLKAVYIPKPIVIHPFESSGKIYDASGLFARGALFFRLYGWKSICVNVIFIIKKWHFISRQGINPLKAMVYIFSGTADYVNLLRRRRID